MTVSAPRQLLPNRRSHWLYRFESDGQFYIGGIVGSTTAELLKSS
jgi:hypothetical protein